MLCGTYVGWFYAETMSAAVKLFFRRVGRCSVEETLFFNFVL